MRGYLEPAKRTMPTESQARFSTLSRGRRTKLAKSAQTTLIKADQWARGDSAPEGVGEALDKALAALGAKTKK
ncbi:MAG TPA: hypothetical protein VF316_03960 [Polyangiaceae bacterium]